MFMCDRTCDLFKVGNFNIKRCLLFLVCIMLLVACGENDPIESRNRHPRQHNRKNLIVNNPDQFPLWLKRMLQLILDLICLEI